MAAPAEFCREILRVSIAQMCSERGFTAVQRSALDTFTDVVLKYIEEIGLSSARLANLAGRSEVNAVDAHVALEDLGVDLTFLQQYIRQADDSGFCKALPRFPLARKVVLCEADPLGTTAATTSTQHQHIPEFLPGFPAPHTYQQSDAFTQFETDPEKVRAIKLQQARAVEDSLLKLHEAKGLQLNSAANSQHADIVSSLQSEPAAKRLKQ